MIFLEFHNRTIEDTLKRALSAEKPDSIDLKITDFDGVTYHISTPQAKTKVLLSISWSCYGVLEANGAKSILEREYASLLTSAESGYNVSLLIDTDALASSPSADDIPRKCALLKRHLFSAPFETCMDLQMKGQKSTSPIIVPYRPDSSVYISAQADRVTVVFSTTFQDADDVVLGKVFLQEFVDVRQKVQEGPQVLHSFKEPPAELKGTRAVTGDNVSYVTFVLFPRHYNNPQHKGPTSNDPARFKCINLIQTFRDYLHYHIKCSKAYLHCHMRARVAESLKILNRARPESKNAIKKTASGKTFVRK